MAKIQQLPLSEIQKIAAGEVVDRPANVVKELIENALDAGATHITVFVEDGGKQLIRCIDNGFGMSPIDARMSIVPHATSKITGIDDLETLATFGFRGEALSSIAAVSRVMLTTKEAEALEGVRLTISEGVITREEPASAAQGTDIAIHDLFYSIPARKKFLKSRETEWRSILHLVQALCLDYASHYFTLYHDGKPVLNCPPAPNLMTRIGQLFDVHLAKSMLVASEPLHTSTGITITGAISNPHYVRYDRSHMFFFVNKRWVKNIKLSQAVLKSYLNVLPQGRYPTAVIFLEVNPAQLDINIHPRKEEVQFLHARAVETALETFVGKQLEGTVTQPFQQPQQQSQQVSQLQSQSVSSLYHLSNPSKQQDEQHIVPAAPTTQEFLAALDKSFNRETQEQAASSHTTQATQISIDNQENTSPSQQARSYRLIGQLYTTYIMSETAEGLMLIDQHAAHERIMYELFSQRFHEVAQVQLLFPQALTLSDTDCLTVLAHRYIFTEHGIQLEQIGPNQFVIQATPVHVQNQPLHDIVQHVISWIHELQHDDQVLFRKRLYERLHTHMACKAAIKAGDALNDAQMHELIAQLHATSNRFTCPHGRPTSWLIDRTSLEKKFKR